MTHSLKLFFFVLCLPLFFKSSSMQSGNEEESNCSICFDVMAAEDIKNLNCTSHQHGKHVFHKICVNEWLSKNPTCPLCRRPVIDELFRIIELPHINEESIVVIKKLLDAIPDENEMTYTDQLSKADILSAQIIGQKTIRANTKKKAFKATLCGMWCVASCFIPAVVALFDSRETAGLGYAQQVDDAHMLNFGAAGFSFAGICFGIRGLLTLNDDDPPLWRIRAMIQKKLKQV